jgi:glucan endo-1,3-alpha-glucosidase
MDMNVLPSSTEGDGQALRGKVRGLLREERYLRWKGQRMLSTFGGHGALFGGEGWEGWLRSLNQELGEKVRPAGGGTSTITATMTATRTDGSR